MNNSSKRKILSVEDTASFRLLIRMTLEFEGFEVLEAENGQTGLDLARTSRPDLILLDLKLPDLNGLTVCQRLMADPALSQIPIVVLSASNDSVEIGDCLEAGAQGYLLKPFRPKFLVDTVRQLVDAPTT
jgi:CheY-like chemotaxis protein